MRHYAGSALMLLVTMVAALASYTVNIRVSAERAAVDGLRRQLVADARDVRNLQAELRTRARLPEMQRWNDNVLLMAAPAAGQYLRSTVQLASFGVPATETAGPTVRFAVAGPATPPAAAERRAVVQTAARAAPSATPVDARVIRAAYAAPRPPAAVAVAIPDMSDDDVTAATAADVGQ